MAPTAPRVHQVTVVVPHYGDPAPTLGLLDQLARQGGAQLQVVVVDDASPRPFPATAGVVVVHREENSGFGTTVNAGARLAEHPWLLILNSDVAITDSFVADLVEAALPWQPAVVSPRVVDGAGHEAWTGRQFPTAAQQTVEWLTPLARFRHTEAWHRGVGHDVAARGRPAVVDWVVGAAMLLPTDAFRAVGGFDERFRMNVEEVDLQRRLRTEGLRSVALQEPTAVHTGGGSSDPALRRAWLVESRLRYADKWGGRRRLRAALSLATGVNLGINAARRAAGRDLSPLTTAREELALIWKGDRSRRASV